MYSKITIIEKKNEKTLKISLKSILLSCNRKKLKTKINETSYALIA